MYPADPPAPEARGAGAAKARGCLPLTELRGHTVSRGEAEVQQGPGWQGDGPTKCGMWAHGSHTLHLQSKGIAWGEETLNTNGILI